MCGHVGAAGKLEGKHEKMIKTLLVLDSLRGEHSTGVAVIGNNNDVKIAKAVGGPHNLFEYKSFDKAFLGMNKVVIGHNRYATQGAITTNNAHPFEFPTIVGAHNGTLNMKWKFINGNDYAVDSMALYDHVDRLGIDSAIKIADGAWALVWWNKENESLNFLRNSERPLFIGIDKKDPVIYWASERWMLTIAASRHGIELERIEELKENTHWRLPIDKQGKFGDDEHREVKSEVVPFVMQQGGNWKKAHSGTNVTALTAHRETKKEEKKTEALQGSLTASEDLYRGGKSRELECVGLHTDPQGGNYISCYDRLFPRMSIRLYYHPKSDDAKLLGKRIFADIGDKVWQTANGVRFFKVEYSTVRKIITKPEESKEEQAEEITTPLLLDHKKEPITEHGWYSKYEPACVWCSSAITPKGDFRYTTEGQVLCPDCAGDAEVNQYVKLVA